MKRVHVSLNMADAVQNLLISKVSSEGGETREQTRLAAGWLGVFCVSIAQVISIPPIFISTLVGDRLGLHWLYRQSTGISEAVHSSDVDFYFTLVGGQLLLFCGVVIPTGKACAWLSDHWFHGTTISVRSMTAVFAILLDFTLIGWLAVLLIA